MNDTLAILEKVHVFYSVAFSQLISYTAGVLALVGILLPTFIAIQQSRQARREKEALEALLRAQIVDARTDLTNGVEARFAEAAEAMRSDLGRVREEIERQMKRYDARARARTLHLQANQCSDRGWHGLACVDACEAMRSYGEGEDELNLIRVVALFSDEAAKLTEADFTPAAISELDIQKAFDRAIEAIGALNVNGRYSDTIKEMKSNLAAAKVRKAERKD